MKFTKDIGKWSDYSTILDDIVYQLYLNEMEDDESRKNPADQKILIDIHSKCKIDKINRAYKIAVNILRKEKIEEINHARSWE